MEIHFLAVFFFGPFPLCHTFFRFSKFPKIMAQTLIFLFILLSPSFLLCFHLSKSNHFSLESPKPKIITIPLKRLETKQQIFGFLAEKQSENASLSQMTLNGFSEIPLHNYKNTQFIGEIAIGASSNIFRVIFDTGSANIWVNSRSCVSDGCKGHKKYDGSSFKGYIPSNRTLNVEFGSGELMGTLAEDIVFLAGIGVEKQTFVEIDHENGEVFSKVMFDGIVGMAFPALSAHNSTPIFDNILKKHMLLNGVFGFFLSKKEKGEFESRLMLGGVDKSLVDGDIRYYDLLEEFYWSIEMDSILINGKNSNLCSKCKAIIDTGTSLITGPSNEISNLLELLNIDHHCSKTTELPTISFVFKGTEYKIYPEDYILNFDQEDTKKKVCAGLFMPLDIPSPRGPAWILGDLFLMNFVSVFDRDRKRVGFAKARRGIN